MPKPDYSSEEWADVVPIPQDEGGPNPLAAIAYTDEYSEASDYLRAVMAANEKSERVLKLTEHIISMNAAHYTVWVYRASVLDALNIPLAQELAFLTSISLKHLKNYQIWHHRQVIVSKLSELPEAEPDFLGMVLARDAKNYHVWSYRQWLVSHFNLWADNGDDTAAAQHPHGSNGELKYVERLLEDDVRNNSAWHHRYFVIFGKPDRDTLPEDVITRELEFAKEQIRIAPQNQSSWNYLQGVARQAKIPFRDLKTIVEEYASVKKPNEIRSTFALDFLADVLADNDEKDNASLALDLLAEKYDPIRKQYWLWRKSQLQSNTVEVNA